jgi:hypothetical protein
VDRMQARIFGPKREKVNNNKLHKLCYPINIIRVIKPREMTWTEQVAHIRQERIV